MYFISHFHKQKPPWKKKSFSNRRGYDWWEIFQCINTLTVMVAECGREKDWCSAVCALPKLSLCALKWDFGLWSLFCSYIVQCSLHTALWCQRLPYQCSMDKKSWKRSGPYKIGVTTPKLVKTISWWTKWFID